MLDEYRQNLVINNSNLVYKIVHKFFGSCKEDLIQQGFVGLCEAAERFDVTKGVVFSTYAYKYIYTNCLSFQLKDSNLKPKRVGTKMVKISTISLDACISEPSNVDLTNDIDIKELIYDKRLNKLERTLLYGCAIGYTKKEIFTRLDINRNEGIDVLLRLKNKINKIKEDN